MTIAEINALITIKKACNNIGISWVAKQRDASVPVKILLNFIKRTGV